MPVNVAEIEEAARRLRSAPPSEIVTWAMKRFGNRLEHRLQLLDRGLRGHRLAMKAARADVRVFALDTGRLPDETYLTAERVRMKYGVEIDWFFPERAAVEKLIRVKGLYSFRDSLDERHECCGIRKVEPLGRALADRDAWMTGPAQRAVGHPHRHARDRDRSRPRQHRQGEPARPLDDGARCAPTPRSTASRSTRCTTAATRRSAAPPARAPSSRASTRAPAAGGGRIPTTRSAASTFRWLPSAYL